MQQQPDPGEAEKRFLRFDGNRDGVLTLQEFLPKKKN